MKAWHLVLGLVAGLAVASTVFAQPPGGDRGGRGGRRGGGFGGDQPQFQGPPGGAPNNFQGGPPGGFPGRPGGGPQGDFRGGFPGGPGGGPQGDFRGGFRGGPGGGPQGNQQGVDRRAQFLDSMMARFDLDGDGTITPKDVAAMDARTKSMYEGMARQAGLDPSASIRTTDLREAMARNMGGRGGPPGGGPPGGPGAPSGMAAGGVRPGQAPVQSSVPGFGVTATPVSVSSFSPSTAAGNVPGGPRPGVTLSPGPGPSPPPAAGNAEVEARAREMANSIFKQYDKNGDGVIDKDEMAQLPPGLRRADRNGDGKITREELVAQMIEFSQRRGGDRPGPDGGPGGGRGGPPGAATATATNNGKPSKFRTALEMLPAGLPDTFLQKDADHDGQISMAEWTTVWSDEEAARFAKYDLNHDGIITAAEFLKVEGQSKLQARR